MRKSKEEKLVAQRMAINATMDKMQSFVAQLEPKKQLFIDKARQAQKSGLVAQEKSARAALKQVMSQQRLAEKMLVNFEIMTNMRDLTEMSGEFLKGLVVMGKQMAGLTAKMDFVKSEKELNKAMIEAQVQTEKMNEFLDRMTVTIDSGFEEAGGIADEEIDAVIGVDETREQRSLDEEIDLKLAELNKKLKQS
ncbi:MAG: hypothetical protein HFK08_01860 [Clostridia bacterium]|jgi:hypothetical protein|nr:hypothetical protein [Clostridia bacterium]